MQLLEKNKQANEIKQSYFKKKGFSDSLPKSHKA